jgi:hypothetical protein
MNVFSDSAMIIVALITIIIQTIVVTPTTIITTITISRIMCDPHCNVGSPRFAGSSFGRCQAAPH